MAKKRRITLSEEEIRKLQEELERVQRYIDECIDKMTELENRALEEVGHKPVIRNPDFRNFDKYHLFVDEKTGKIKDWFWTDKPGDSGVYAMCKRAARPTFFSTP
jgi:Asp-tRNA(Asn)/Glu-tRNA(Gln) amidotransferase C subunit